MAPPSRERLALAELEATTSGPATGLLALLHAGVAGQEAGAAQEGLEIFKELNDSLGLEMAYSNLARWAAMRGDFQESEKYLALAGASTKKGAISIQSGFLNLGLGVGARYQGRYEVAQRHLEEGLRIMKHIGHKGMIAALTSEIAHTKRAMGNFAEAKQTYRETIKVFQDYGNRPAVAHQLECFASIAIADEEPQRAAKVGMCGDQASHCRTYRSRDIERHPDDPVSLRPFLLGEQVRHHSLVCRTANISKETGNETDDHE